MAPVGPPKRIERSGRRIYEEVHLNQAHRWFCRLDLTNPAARFTGANGDRAFFAESTDYLVDLEDAVIVGVETTAPVRQAEIGAARDMILRTRERNGTYPEFLAAEKAYGSAEMLGWLAENEGIAPHIPVLGKTERQDGTFAAISLPTVTRMMRIDVLLADRPDPTGGFTRKVGRSSARTASSVTSRARKIAKRAHQRRNARQTKTREKSPDQGTKARDRWPGTSRKPMSKSRRAMHERRSKCSSPISNASSVRIESASEDQTKPRMGSISLPRFRTSANSPSWRQT